LTPERWAQIEELFHRTVQCDPQRQTALLDEACDGDNDLRREVEMLLATKERASDRLEAAVQVGLDVVAFPLVGETVSHYHILDGLGGGGMGLVYRAEDVKLGRQVALKFLPEDSAKDPAALGRFEREARSASALVHPNICPIYEFGEHEGQPFLVMQLLEGQNLRELISATGSGKLPFEVDTLLDMAIQISSGLEAAHDHGIIHRDIKPANIFVTTQGEAKILDFGLAKFSRESQEEESESTARDSTKGMEGRHRSSLLATPDPLLSRSGVTMGTAGYMSPEQMRGEELDPRTDQFSLGLILYEMATGQRAFKGDTGPALHGAIFTQTPVPARQLNPQVPAKLDQIIAKTLEKNRTARYQTVSELRAELETLKRKIAPKSRLRRSVVIGAPVLALVVVSAIIWLEKRHLQSGTPLPNLKLEQLTINSSENPVTGGAISPDGKYLAYTDVRGMHIKLVGSDQTVSVPQSEVFKNGVTWEISGWFPDSTRFLANAHPTGQHRSLWSSDDSSIWVVSVLGGVPRQLREHALAWSVSPDGSSVSFGTNKASFGEREIWLMTQSGEQAHKLYEVGEKNAICCLQFFPNGERVSYIRSDQSGDTLVAHDLRGGPVTVLLPPSEMQKMGDATWLPDGRIVYSDPCNSALMRLDTPCNYWSERIDTHSGQVIEKPRRLTNWVGFWMNNPSATADGKHVAFLKSSGEQGTAYVADLETGGTHIHSSRHFTLEEGDDFIDGWFLDGKAALVGVNRGDHYGLFKQSLDSDTPEPIAPAVKGGLLEDATLSPDGRWVVALVWPLTGSPDDESRPQPIVRVPVTGGTPEEIFRVVRPNPLSCARAPSNLCVISEQTADHKQMVVTAFDPVKGRGAELERFDLARDIDLSVDDILSVISPEGTRLAITRSPEGPIEIQSLSRQPTLTVHARGLDKLGLIRWSADGKALFVSSRTKDGAKVLHLDLQGHTQLLWKCNGECFGTPSPDGRHLAVSDRSRSANMWMMENF
jgi:serine/threonine protein kinase